LRSRPVLRLRVAALFVLGASAASPHATPLYRCTTPQGVVWQEVPCRNGKAVAVKPQPRLNAEQGGDPVDSRVAAARYSAILEELAAVEKERQALAARHADELAAIRAQPLPENARARAAAEKRQIALIRERERSYRAELRLLETREKALRSELRALTRNAARDANRPSRGR